jgi:16S rRNA (uracil1498-N3)-methyltransferase
MHRFIGNFPLGEKRFWIADKELVKQVSGVLRLEPGEKIILSDGQGGEADAEILSYDKDAVEVSILEGRAGTGDPAIKTTLYLSILKKENFDLAVQKCVEIGVSKIVPIITKRTVKLGLKRDRLEKIMKEAAEQSGRSVLPILDEELEFKKAVAGAKENDLNFFFTLGGKPLELKAEHKDKKIGIFIGPEGGFDDFEVESAKAARFILAGLGSTTLRAETAAIAATHEIIFNLGRQ